MTVLLPAWLQTGTYSAEIDRSVPTGLLMANGTTTSRGGVRYWAGTELKVFPTGPATLQVIVNPGIAWVQGGYSTTQGMYVVLNDAAVTLPVTAPPASNSRIDLVVLEVLDQTYSGSSNLAQLRIATGTSAPSPTAPVVTGNFIVLAQLLITSGTNSVSSAAITDTRPFTVAAGSVVPVANKNQRDAITTLPAGTEIIEMDTLRVWQWTGSFWDYMRGGAADLGNGPPTISLSPASDWYLWDTSANYWEQLRAMKVGGVVHVQGLIGNDHHFYNPNRMFTLPVGYRPERNHITSCFTGIGWNRRIDVRTDGGVYAYPGSNGRTHPRDDWWAVDLHFMIRNHSVG